MDISEKDKAAVLESIACIRAYIEDPNDPESIEACTRFDKIAAKIITQKTFIYRGRNQKCL